MDGKRTRSGSIEPIEPPEPAKRPKMSPTASSSSSRVPTLHSWLHPGDPPPLVAHSPPLHNSTSTFLSFAIAFEPPAHIQTESSLAKEVRRVVRELNVPGLVGEQVMHGDEGAFHDGEGRVGSGKGKGKERAREPDHRMWAVRTLCLKEGKDGTAGEGDYQLLESFNDDGEKYGGERVMRIMRESRAVDMIIVCCRWYGGDMLGPIRFQHIGITAQTAIKNLSQMTALRDLRAQLEALDDEIASLRETLNPSATTATPAAKNSYDDIDDVARLERLVKAREKTRQTLEGRASWAAAEQARANEAGS